DSSHEVVKLPLDGGKIIEDVSMIELQVVQDRCASAVVNELRALVEECGVVLVRFDYEERAAGMARRGRKIERNAAKQKPGRSPGALEDPGQHGRNRGFAMSAGRGG